MRRTESPFLILCSFTPLFWSLYSLIVSFALLSSSLASLMSFLPFAGLVLRSGSLVLNFLLNRSSAGHFFMVECGVARNCIRYSEILR